jgi:hypothetical protein
MAADAGGRILKMDRPETKGQINHESTKQRKREKRRY